ADRADPQTPPRRPGRGRQGRYPPDHQRRGGRPAQHRLSPDTGEGLMTTRRDYLGLTAAAGLALAAPRARGAGPPRKLRLLILGGTGFIGPHEVRYALARGHEVTIFNRGRQKEDWPGHVEELLGDRNTGDLKSLEGREWDVCIDNPTTLPFWVRDAAHVLKGRVKRYIFVSTISVYSGNETPGADETASLASYKGGDPMAETQAAVAKDPALYG